MNSPRSRLDRIRQACLAGRPLAPEDALALARAIEIAERDDVSIDAAMGLAAGWQRTRKARQRDAMLRDLARSIAGSNRRAAREIRAKLTRYAASAFMADLRQDSPLEGERATLFGILVANDGAAPSAELIRKIVALA